MKFTYRAQLPEKDKTDCLVVFLHEGASLPDLPKPLHSVLKTAFDLNEFSGKAGDETLLFTQWEHTPRLLAMGLGKPEDLTRETLRRTVGRAAQRLNKLNCAQAGLLIPEKPSSKAKRLPEGFEKRMAEVLAESLLEGAYRFENYKADDKDKKNKKEKKNELKTVFLFDPEKSSSASAMNDGVARGEAVCLARDLGNHPGNTMTPTRLAQEAKKVCSRHGMKFKVLEQKDMEKLGMELFLGVARGSIEPPKLIFMEYRPKGAKQTLAFVGKGITFDSGGISLKPGAAMDEMKFDMCGAAAVVGAMEAVGRLKPMVNVVGIIPACENLPGGKATKPGDILKSYAGKHVEILNTDAEGRLVLADALAYGVDQYKPDAVIDLATLTGACVVALGHYASGAIGNHDAFMDKVVQAGKSSGDVVWPLPNFPDYEEALKGKYADLQNIGGRDGGAITGGLFLKPFVKDTPWAHLDIAGTAWGVKNVGHIPYDGATGVGVCLLVDLALSWKSLK